LLPLSLPLSAHQVTGPSNSSMVWVIDEVGHVFAVDGRGGWEQMALPASLCALDVSAGPGGNVWFLVADEAGSRPTLLRRGPSGKTDIMALAAPTRKITVSPSGVPWIITASGEVWSLTPEGAGRRHSPPGQDFAAEVSAGLDGSVWIISATRRYGGHIVKRLPWLSDQWFELPAPAAASKLAIAPDGMAWTINAHGAVWRLHPLGGGNLAECQVNTGCSLCRFSTPFRRMSEISVGPDGTVWTIGPDQAPGETTLKWLANPLGREYRTIPTPFRPARLAAGLKESAVPGTGEAD
jgi:hypothetical protein